MVPAEEQIVDSVTQKKLVGIWAQRAVLSGPPASPTLGGSSGNTGDVLEQYCAVRCALETPHTGARPQRLVLELLTCCAMCSVAQSDVCTFLGCKTYALLLVTKILVFFSQIENVFSPPNRRAAPAPVLAADQANSAAGGGSL